MAYNACMDTISPEIEKELERRMAAGSYGSLDELLGEALKALDDARVSTRESLEQELLIGLDREEVEMEAADWDDIEREALEAIESKKAQ